jgi:signal transduction histidine kinase
MENLLSNAVKYADSKRRITVSTAFVNGSRRSEVQVNVADNGIGIPSRELSSIFEPFYRVPSARESRIRGTGLGLYLVKKLMEEMGGTVTVASELGRGTSFVLHFPVTDPKGQQQTPA